MRADDLNPTGAHRSRDDGVSTSSDAARSRGRLAAAALVGLSLGLAVVVTITVGAGMLPAEAPRASASGSDSSSSTPDGMLMSSNNIAYGSARDVSGERVELLMDVVQTSGSTEARPSVVLIHGGGFKAGSRKDPRLREIGRSLARHGYVVALPDYRVDQSSPRDSSMAWSRAARDAQHDVQAAVRYLRRHADRLGVDEDRIAVAGTSAGGITALRVGFNPRDVGESGNSGFSSRVNASISIWGGAPRSIVRPGAPPTLMFHGKLDRKLEFWLSRGSCLRSEQQGNVCDGVWWPTDGHSPWRRSPEIADQMAEFLALHM